MARSPPSGGAGAGWGAGPGKARALGAGWAGCRARWGDPRDPELRLRPGLTGPGPRQRLGMQTWDSLKAPGLTRRPLLPIDGEVPWPVALPLSSVRRSQHPPLELHGPSQPLRVASQATPQPGTPRLCLELTVCARQLPARGPSMSSGIRRDLRKPELGLEAPRFTESSSACAFESQNPFSWQSATLEAPSPSHTKATHFPGLQCCRGGHLIAIVKHSGEETWGFPFMGFEFISENIVQNQ